MKNNTEKLKETEIEISVRTGVMHANKADEAQTQIDYTSYYVGALNYFIRIALEAQNYLDMQTESVVLKNDSQFRENLRLLTQLSDAFNQWLPDYAYDLAKHSKVKTDAPEVLDLSEQSEDCQRLNKLSVHLSEVLKSPLTPPEVKECLSDHFTTVVADNSSPEWILGNLKKMNKEAK